MKIAILTLQLQNNYGCILQNFALQTALKAMGHEVETVNLAFQTPGRVKVLSICKRLALRYLCRQDIPVRGWTTAREKTMIRQHLIPFVREYISLTPPLRSRRGAAMLNDLGFDGYVVGSDQCWRPAYTRGNDFYFLGFVPPEAPVKRVAYAASFGREEWEFSPAQTRRCAELAARFDAISVREASGVDLCRTHLNAAARHVLDPVLLPEKELYEELVEKRGLPPEPGGYVATYLLDAGDARRRIAEQLANRQGLPIRDLLPARKFEQAGRRALQECVLPPLESWLQGIMNAEYVVTDSFHGTVLAILFGKPFLTIGNRSRGMARFHSLLEMFGLPERLIGDGVELTPEQIERPIDYDSIKAILERKRRDSLAFLAEALS